MDKDTAGFVGPGVALPDFGRAVWVLGSETYLVPHNGARKGGSTKGIALMR